MKTQKLKSSTTIEPGELYVNIEYIEFDPVNIKCLTKPFFELLKNRVKTEVPELLTYANFLGEAETYMCMKGIPYSPKTREQYARAIRNELMDKLEDLLVFNEDDGTISISPYILALENGDFYRPAIGFISKCIKEWINKEEQNA